MSDYRIVITRKGESDAEVAVYNGDKVLTYRMIGEGRAMRFRDIGAFVQEWLPEVKEDDPSAREFSRYAPVVGLKPEDLGKEFKAGRDRFKITGLKMSRHKYPVSAVRVKDNKPFKFGVSSVKIALAAEESVS